MMNMIAGGAAAHPFVTHNKDLNMLESQGLNMYESVQANFLRYCKPNSPLSKLKCACDTQKCIRAGGKHNDLDDIYRLLSERIYVTYFGGNEKSSLPADNEARDLWLQFLSPSRMLPFDFKGIVYVVDSGFSKQ
ncbi:hypothetical protein CQW23_06342 [Capsicum baccatum]|uniref:Uncharacterized protein n=1 Tax=Capsicum baccatum TaxID=33114 RepID=A0A2G2X348_CAPBA|nr:hypothetical protein CQW23_06342 [Capsicum baccatum]